MTSNAARRGYETASSFRSTREQEADVFRRVNGALRASEQGSPVQRVRALADNRRLWRTMSDLLRDPDNGLPRETRAALLSIGLTVEREMEEDQPDLAFLIAVNENIAAGLSGAA